MHQSGFNIGNIVKVSLFAVLLVVQSVESMHVLTHSAHFSLENKDNSTTVSKHEACLLCTHYSQIFNEFVELNQYKSYSVSLGYILVSIQLSETHSSPIECLKSRGPPPVIA